MFRQMNQLVARYYRRRKNRNQGLQKRARFFEQLEPRLVLNGLPITKPDNYSTPVDTALTINSGSSILLNDWDPEGSITASIVANPNHGAISSFISSAGTLVYTPDNSYVGIDSFTYKTNDGSADGNTVTVSIAVGGNFGPRTNLNEEPQFDGEAPLTAALPSGCTTKMDPVRLTASCLTGDLVMAQTLTPGIDLIYNSGTLAKPIIVLETFLTPDSDVPDEIKARLTFNGSNGTTYSYDTDGLEAGDSLRFSLQADATGLATDRYGYTVRLTATIDSTPLGNGSAMIH